MKRIIFTLLAFISVPVYADQKTIDIDSVAGVYRRHFPTGDVNGYKYQGEDILEVVEYSPDSVYFRGHFEFFNGHMCGIYGIANLEGDSLVYHGLKNSEGNLCTLRIKISDKELRISDEQGNCRVDTCGSRGGYNNSLSRSSKHKITYLDKILNSDAYWGAVEEYSTKADQYATTEGAHEAGTFKHMMKLAQDGDLHAARTVAWDYQQGRGVERDGTEAIKWYRKGADKNDAFAQHDLALIYERISDFENAAIWYRKAAAQGHGNAQYRLGLLYAHGTGTKQNDKEAYFWVKTALLESCEQSSYLEALEDIGLNLTQEEKAQLDKRAREWKPQPSKVSQKSGLVFPPKRPPPTKQECADYKKHWEEHRKKQNAEQARAPISIPVQTIQTDSWYQDLVPAKTKE